jgi:oxygen-independent coproporphyrinogen-3 oxidase
MAVAARTGHLRRNFQGYTDDTCDVLIGLGASAISRSRRATPRTPAPRRNTRPPCARGDGHRARSCFKGEDLWRGRMIEMLLCNFAIDTAEIRRRSTSTPKTLSALYKAAAEAFPGMTQVTA